VWRARADPGPAPPAMNDAMYAHPASLANLKPLAARGWHFIGPDTGALAEGPSDRPGRMSEPEAIQAAAARLLVTGGRLTGKTVVVTAGPTREHLRSEERRGGEDGRGRRWRERVDAENGKRRWSWRRRGRCTR